MNTNTVKQTPAQLDASVTPLSPPLPGAIGRFLAVQGWTPKPFGKLDWLIAAFLFITTGLIRIISLQVMDPDRTVVSILQQWDALHFVDIAQYGYFSADGQGVPDPEVFQQRLAFFPGLPGLIQQVHLLTGWNYIISGWFVVLISGIVMTAGFMALAALLGAGMRGRILAAFLLLGAPMAVTFNMVYTEAPFMALCFWALVFMLQGRWWQTTLFIYLLGFLRLTAIDMVLTFAIIVLLYARTNWKAWLGVVLSGLSLITYIRYASSYTEDIGGYFGMQAKGWHSSFDWGAATIKWTYESLRDFNETGYILSIISIIGSIVAMGYAFRRLPWALWIFGAGITANILLSDGIMHSRPRLLLPALILLLPIALWLEKLVLSHATVSEPPTSDTEASDTEDSETDVSISYTWNVAWIGPALAWFIFGTWFSGYMLIFFEWAI